MSQISHNLIYENSIVLLMSNALNAFVDRLALAKEMYSIGIHHSKINTRTNHMMSILNFDFSITTIVVSACLYSGQSTKNNKGKTKKWEELLESFRKNYNNQSMITDIDGLHDLRNSIQHGDTVPSDWDIKKYTKVVKDFFDDVCKSVFQNKLTYDSVSLSKLLKSPHEIELMTRVERLIEEGKYDLAAYFAYTTVLYHYNLIRKNLSISSRIFPFFDTFEEDFANRKISQKLHELSDALDHAIDRLAIGEFYSKMKYLLEKGCPRRYGIDPSFDDIIIPENTTFDQISELQTDIYSIILGTEHILTDSLVLELVIYGITVTDIMQTSAKISYGIFSSRDIKECKLIFIRTSADTEIISPIELTKKEGYHELVVDKLTPGKRYNCEMVVSPVSTPNEFKRSRSMRFNITTKN